MLEITPNGSTYYIWPSQEREFFGTLEPVDNEGYRKLMNPTPAFWKLWKQHPWRMKNQFSFQVHRVNGKWEVWMHVTDTSGIQGVA